MTVMSILGHNHVERKNIVFCNIVDALVNS